MAKELAIDVIKRFETLEPIAQNGCVASYCKKIKREDGLINLDSAKEIYKKFRAYRGWPDIFLENGLKLIDIELVDSNNHYRSGEILEINRDSIVVGCNKGSIKIYKLQPKSKKVMDAISYIVGRRLRVGDLII
ncbi:MAG: methionyl-tRNA formyltransferase, partial [Epsilonproteobacteria bacterium]|nr:methionyl-tRNA formyltransferase [Campylobacterota bacterium]